MSTVAVAGTAKEPEMDTMYRCCAGVDVHKQTVAVCVRRMESLAREVTLEPADRAA